MTNPAQHSTLVLGSSLRGAAYALALLCALAMVAMQSAQAQTFTVIHTFTGPDGEYPQGNLAMDAGGNLYGTTRGATAYKLSARHNWVLSLLYSFTFGADGYDPQSGVVFGPDGTLFGTTYEGGVQNCMAGCGTIFNLKPGATAPASAIAPWSETVLYSFQGTPDGEYPANGPLVFDQAGAAYGTTPFGGNHQGCLRETCGVVYKLVRSGGNWVESVLYAFAGDPDGAQPYGGVIMDEAGNLYGTTYQGGTHGWGTVFELTPSQGGWTKTTLYQFTGGSDGGQTSAGLTRDSAGNLYGVTPLGGFGSGTIFELSRVGGQWTFTVLYSFIRGGPGPFAPLTIDTAGNLYGTTMGTGIYGGGELFELSPSGAGWTYSVLHDFTWGAGGALPQSPVLLSPSGELYGTTYEGGGGGCGNGCGTVWQFTR